MDTLGCGEYEVYFKSRGGDFFVCRARDITKLSYGRKLNAVSEASIVITMKGQTAECCECIGSINPWEHEISIYRNGEEVWCGPVTGAAISLSALTATFNAKDLSSWFDRRWVEVADNDQEFEEADITEIYEWLMGHGYYKDPWNMEWQLAPTGIPLDKTYPSYSLPDRWGGTYPNIGDELRNLSKSGLDFTVIRRMYVGGNLTTATDVEGVLYDNDWTTLPDIEIVGTGMATEVGVAGGAGGYYGWDDDQIWIERPYDEYRERFGLLQVFIPAPNLDDADTTIQPNAITQQAYSLRELKKEPFVYIQGGSLSPEAPLTFDLLIPGKVFSVTMTQTCRLIQSDYRLYQVDVSYDGATEEVAVQLTPLGADALKTDITLSDGDG